MLKIISAYQMPVIKEPFVAITLIEHIGDIVACEPVIRYVAETYPKHKIVWVAKPAYFGVLIGHPQIDYLAAIDHLCETEAVIAALPAHAISINLHFNGRICLTTRKFIQNGNDERITSENYFHWGSILEAFSQCARLPRLNAQPMLHLASGTTLPDIPEKFVVFHCMSNEAEKDWSAVKWRKLLYFFIRKNIAVLEVGLVPVLRSNNPLYYDMTATHSLQAIAAIISKASFFVGVDSAFAHFANALHINGLVIMGKYRAFSEHVPYTGYYAEAGHIVRELNQRAAEVPVEAVIERYQQLTV